MRIAVVGVGRIGALHARTLRDLPLVDEVIVVDADPHHAGRVATDLGVRAATDLDAALAAGVDALVIATATPAHADLIRSGLAAGLPTFCEKPVASTLTETIDLAETVREADVPVQIGFQRRFDRGYLAAKAAVDSGELGPVHVIHAVTHDRVPPHPDYLPTSGGIFRDCSIHDIDIVRFVTGREVRSVYATGSDTAAPFFASAGDVNAAAAILTLDDDTLVTVTASRYSGGGYDVRLELIGENGGLAVGLDDSLAMRSAEPGVTFPDGPPHPAFMDRFVDAYRAELAAFCDVAAGRRPVPCTVDDALAAFRVADACETSRAEHRLVELTAIHGALA